MTKQINANGLLLDYFQNFLNHEKSNSLFDELLKLEFQDCYVKVYGKTFKPLRKVLAFGEPGVRYGYSGTSVQVFQWTTSLLQLKEEIEKLTSFSYNYVLLNLYQNGYAKISPHKDNESSIDTETPIATVSLGATRKMQFQRKNFKTVSLPLHHGSLLLMREPTNQLYTHAIPMEPKITNPRISLTFRRIHVNTCPMKRKHCDS